MNRSGAEPLPGFLVRWKAHPCGETASRGKREFRGIIWGVAGRGRRPTVPL